MMAANQSSAGFRSRGVALLFFLVALSACGTRLDEATIAAAQSGSVGRDTVAAGRGDAVSTVTGDDEIVAGDVGAPGADNAGPDRDANSASPGATRQRTGAAERPEGDGRLAAGAPIVIGNVGSYSGAVGSSYAGGQTTLRVWARWVNEHGGIAGHPIKLVTANDDADPARYQALVKDIVENQGAVAFVWNANPFATAAPRKYLEEKRIPIVGGDLSQAAWNASPMYFPQGGTGPTLPRGWAKLGASTGKKKAGIFYCVESPTCSELHDGLFNKGELKKNGLEPTYAAQVSLTQPDFTSECIQAQSRGVELLYLAVDANSLSRISSSCARQNFKPTYLLTDGTGNEKQAENSNLEGTLLRASVFPWSFTGSPAATEYRDALERYAPDLGLSGPTALAWTAGKLLEKAVANAGGDVTSEGILKGLWAMKDETLGGLAPPLTFVAEQPAKHNFCYFSLRYTAGKTTAMNGGKYQC